MWGGVIGAFWGLASAMMGLDPARDFFYVVHIRDMDPFWGDLNTSSH